MSARVYDFDAFRAAQAKKQHAREVATALVQAVHQAGFDLVPRAEPTHTFSVPRRTRGEAWRASRRCAICRELGHDRSTCGLAAAARKRAKELGVNFGEALELLKREATNG